MLYWHCLDMLRNDEGFVALALEELCDFLRTEPTKLCITPKRLKDERELVKKVDIILYKVRNQPNEFERGTLDIVNVLPKTTHLLFYCTPDSEIAKAARSFSNNAIWGICQPYCLTCNSFAVVYKLGNKFIIWHEALHLLGADDCYDENNLYQKNPDCDFPDGIMQYAPTQKNVRDWPFLCNKNVNMIRKKVEFLTHV